MRKIGSSGGVGDALIVLSKLYRLHVESRGMQFLWNHYSRHEYYRKACQNIIDHSIVCGIISGSQFICTRDTKQKAKEFGEYIDTNCNIDIKLELPETKQKFNSDKQLRNKILTMPPYICVQFSAGRPNDATKRVISGNTIKQIRDLFPQYNIVLVNQERIRKLDDDFLIDSNLSGTESILEAFEIVNSASLFVGQDGALAYYAMMRGIPTLINFHLHTLPSHYMNNAWREKSVMVVGGSELNLIPTGAMKELKDKV